MNATATKGIWEEKLSEDVTLIFKTNRDPERITISHKKFGPVHLEYEDGINEKDILKARARAKEAYNIV
jgi:hypothetical protein